MDRWNVGIFVFDGVESWTSPGRTRSFRASAWSPAFVTSARL